MICNDGSMQIMMGVTCITQALRLIGCAGVSGVWFGETPVGVQALRH